MRGEKRGNPNNNLVKLENDHLLPALAGGSLNRNTSASTVEVYDFDPSHASAAMISKKLKPTEDAMTSDLGISTVVVEAEQLNSSESEKCHSVDLIASNSDTSYADGSGYDDDYLDDASEYDDEDVEYLYDDDNYLKMQAQFDNVDLPPGVEATVSWPIDSVCSKIFAEDTNVASSSRVTQSNSVDKNEEMMDDVLRKLMYFKQFDTVEDYSDHHYKDQGLVGNNQPPKTCTKKIQEEWKILKENLPETIFVRAYESRMDLLRAAIIGPDDTPYHDGLFFFDVMFPASYPSSPPLVHYHSGGVRLNPNLYNCGKVCLSLLGTWAGNSTELWIPKKSTMLQVLVSIQALILNDKPFFNEPGYESSRGRADGERKSKAYSEEAFILSLKTMMYSLRNPLKNFEDLIAGHFRVRAPDIITACKVYQEGAEVGSNVRKMVKQGEKVENKNSADFKRSLPQVVKNLREAFIKNGSTDCGEIDSEE